MSVAFTEAPCTSTDITHNPYYRPWSSYAHTTPLPLHASRAERPRAPTDTATDSAGTRRHLADQEWHELSPAIETRKMQGRVAVYALRGAPRSRRGVGEQLLGLLLASLWYLARAVTCRDGNRARGRASVWGGVTSSIAS